MASPWMMASVSFVRFCGLMFIPSELCLQCFCGIELDSFPIEAILKPLYWESGQCENNCLSLSPFFVHFIGGAGLWILSLIPFAFFFLVILCETDPDDVCSLLTNTDSICCSLFVSYSICNWSMNSSFLARTVWAQIEQVTAFMMIARDKSIYSDWN